MTNSQRLANVRACLVHWLAEQGETNADDAAGLQSPIQRESILIRDEFFVGRRFHTAHHTAVWFIEQDELKVYKADGQLACVFHSDEITARASQSHDEQPHVLRLPNVSSASEIRRAA
jgi:hypothetical protein